MRRRKLALGAAGALLCAVVTVLLAAALGGSAGERPAAKAERLCGEARPPGELAVSGKKERPGEEAGCEDLERELQDPADAMLQRVAFGSQGKAPTDVLRRARREAAASLARTEVAAPRVANADWKFMGPANIGGRVLDLALDPDQPDTVWIATAGGGVFKSTDRGVTTEPAWPADYPQSIGALVMTPKGVLLAGTGEAGPGGGSLTYGGDGLYRSKDRGKTWERLKGLEKISRVGRIVVDPTDEKRIFVAGLGNLFKPTTDRGVYLSEDGGDTWKQVLKGDNQTTGAADIAIDPKNPKRVLATMWDHQRFPDQKNYNGIGSGVYRSLDGGKTWSRIALGIIGPNPLLGRLGVAIDPQSPNNVYVIAAGGVGGHAGFYKSTDFGNTFLLVVNPNHFGLSGAFVYGWWFGRVWVDPRNSSNLYVAGLDLLKSSDAGITFNSTSGGMHVDQHALVWDPRIPNRMYAGNDGGLYRSDNGGSEWRQARYQPYTQPDALDVSEKDPTRIVIGAQDNMQIRSYGAKDWNNFGPGGDGQRVTINPKDQNIVYSCGQNGVCEVSHDGGNTGTSFENAIISTRKLFFMPIELDPANPSRVFTGGDIINRSDDDAGSFTPISPDVSNGPGRETNPLYIDQGAASAIGVQAGGQKLYVGTDDGNLWSAVSETEIGLDSWTKLSDSDLPKAYVTRVEVDQARPRVAYVTYSGYRAGDAAAYVLRTLDGGQTWENITGDLPKAPVNDINVVDDKLVVASDFGVYASKDTGQTWFRVGRNLPLTPIYELRTHRPSNQLFVATFGRGVYKVGLHALEGLATDDVPAVVAAKKTFLGLPRLRPCKATSMRLRVKAPKGTTLTRASIFVGSKRVRTLKGKALRRAVRVRLPRGRVAVRIVARTATGDRLDAKRTYKACPKRKSKRRG